MKKWLAILGLVTSMAAFSNEPAPHCDQFMPYGYPTVMGRAHTSQLCRIAFYTLHDDQLKVPVYSVELLLPENINGVNPRIDKFKADPDLQAVARAVPGDYVGSGYDKGHMAPVEDMRKDSAAMLQSFYMSNMVPQDPILNRGVWRSIENQARKLAISKNGVDGSSGVAGSSFFSAGLISAIFPSLTTIVVPSFCRYSPSSEVQYPQRLARLNPC